MCLSNEEFLLRLFGRKAKTTPANARPRNRTNRPKSIGGTIKLDPIEPDSNFENISMVTGGCDRVQYQFENVEVSGCCDRITSEENVSADNTTATSTEVSDCCEMLTSEEEADVSPYNTTGTSTEVSGFCEKLTSEEDANVSFDNTTGSSTEVFGFYDRLTSENVDVSIDSAKKNYKCNGDQNEIENGGVPGCIDMSDLAPDKNNENDTEIGTERGNNIETCFANTLDATNDENNCKETMQRHNETSMEIEENNDYGNCVESKMQRLDDNIKKLRAEIRHVKELIGFPPKRVETLKRHKRTKRSKDRKIRQKPKYFLQKSKLKHVLRKGKTLTFNLKEDKTKRVRWDSSKLEKLLKLHKETPPLCAKTSKNKNIILLNVLKKWVKDNAKTIKRKKKLGVSSSKFRDDIQSFLFGSRNFGRHVEIYMYPVRKQGLNSYFESLSLASQDENNRGDPMAYEWFRFASYASFPGDCPVRPIKLAAAGFYYTGQGSKVKCYSCGTSYENWTPGDDSITVHQQISPSCAHLRDVARNVSITERHINHSTNSVSTIGNAANNATMQNTSTREATCARSQTQGGNLTDPGTSSMLNNPAESNTVQQQVEEASMYNQQRNQQEQIPSQQQQQQRQPQQQEQQQQQQQQQHEERQISQQQNLRQQQRLRHHEVRQQQHQRQQQEELRQEQIPHQQGPSSEQRRNNNQQQTQSGISDQLDTLGINFDKPKYPSYAVLTVRISSFQKWPSHLTQTPREMALAGFFYAGYADYCRCFFCGGGLRSWDDGDDPWVEHARWFPKCYFIRQNKGDAFVLLVRQRQAELERESELGATASSQVFDTNETAGNQILDTNEMAMGQDLDPSGSDPHTLAEKEVDKSENKIEDMEEKLRSPAALSVMEIGYTRDQVKQAIEILVKATQNGNTLSAAKILNTIFSLENGEPYHEENNVIRKEQSEVSISDEQQHEYDELLKENLMLKQQKLCRICAEEDANIAFLPCGHLICCGDCAPAMRTCPQCKGFVRGTVKTWLV